MENNKSLDELKEALASVPGAYHKEVCKSLIHDIGVIARTISMTENRPA